MNNANFQTVSASGKTVYIVDDFICKEYEDMVEKDLDPEVLPVKLLKASDSDKGALYPSASVVVFEQNGIEHTAFWYLLPLLMQGIAKTGKALGAVARVRVGVYFGNGLGITTKNRKHLDRVDDHMVAIYYPTDCDGDTLIYESEDANEPCLSITPKKGRLLIMDGSTWHSSSNPSKSVFRTTVNFNFQYKK